VWGVLVGGRRVNGGDEGDMVNGLHIHTWNGTMKPLTISLMVGAI
jgi:hypothetical protein